MTADKVMRLSDALYLRGWRDLEKGRNYDPRGTTEWQETVNALASSAAAPEQGDRAQRMRDAGYTRRPTLRERADEVQPTMTEAIAAGDGLLHEAIDYWQARALAAEAKIPSEAEQDAHATNQVLANNYLHMTCAPPAAPLSEPTAEGVTDDQWIELAERHAARDWNSDKLGGYLNAVKALCTDFSALSPPRMAPPKHRTRTPQAGRNWLHSMTANNTPTPSALAVELMASIIEEHGCTRRAWVEGITHLAALASAAHGEPVAWHFTEMQSGDVHVDWVEPERDQRDRYWIRPLVYGDTRPTAPAEPIDPVTEACRDVLGERRRQVEAEGWTAQGDDDYANGQLALAAAAYALADHVNPQDVPACWPWGRAWFKANDERRNLVKAGALILAEIERLDRVALQANDTTKGK